MLPRLNILMGVDATAANPFARQLVQSLSATSDIDKIHSGRDIFWLCDEPVDVVQLHWPEYLVAIPGFDEGTHLARVEQRLRFLRRRGAIVLTVHNRYPHYQQTPFYQRLFELVYGYVDGFIHMGAASLHELSERFPELSTKLNTIIPHGSVIDQYPVLLTPPEARSVLQVPLSGYVYLSFGSLRHEEEANLLLSAFERLAMPDKYLIIAGSRLVLPSQVQADLAEDRRVLFRPQEVPDEEVSTYAQASNVVVIPRLQALNSGGVAFGFSFGKVVVGTDDGNIGEILRETGNAVFDPAHPETLVEAMRLARMLDEAGKGAQNLRYAEGSMNWVSIAGQHVAFYRRVLDKVCPRFETS